MSALHSRHLWVDAAALDDIGDARLGSAFRHAIEKAAGESPYRLLVNVGYSEGVVVWLNVKCDCEAVAP